MLVDGQQKHSENIGTNAVANSKNCFFSEKSTLQSLHS